MTATWIKGDALKEPGNYLMSYGSFHTPQFLLIVGRRGSNELNVLQVSGTPTLGTIDPSAAYYGPIEPMPEEVANHVLKGRW